MKGLSHTLSVFYLLSFIFFLTNCKDNNIIPTEIYYDTIPVHDTISVYDTIIVYEYDTIKIMPIDGYDYLGAIDNHLYYINNTSTSWTDARTQAGQHGHLVTISSQIENDSILSMISPLSGQPHVWIGLHDSNLEGSFEWVTNEELIFTNWNDGEPNNSGDEDYVIMHGSNHTNPGSWGDQPNSVNLYRHILEIE